MNNHSWIKRFLIIFNSKENIYLLINNENKKNKLYKLLSDENSNNSEIETYTQ